MTGDTQIRREKDGSNRGRPVPALSYLALSAGVALFAVLVAYHGAADIGTAVARVGSGILLIAAFHVTTLVAHSLAWRQLLPPHHAVSIGSLLWARWIGESINDLIPVLQVGGNVVRAQFLARSGLPGSLSGAGVVVDVTLNLLSQLLFTAVGIALLLLRIGSGSLARTALLGALGMALIAAAFLALQRRGLFELAAHVAERIVGDSSRWSFTTTAQSLDAAVRRLYGARRGFAAALAWHSVAWLLGAVEVWIALRFLGQHATLTTTLLLESLAEAVRTAAFAVPAALGVQEGGYLLLGAVLGIPADIALSLSIVKRVRELLLGLPGLAAWQAGGVASAIRPEEP